MNDVVWLVIFNLILYCIVSFIMAGFAGVFKKEEPLLAIFGLLALSLPFWHMFYNTKCLKGMVWRDCPICPHHTTYYCMVNLMDGFWQIVAYVLFGLNCLFAFVGVMGFIFGSGEFKVKTHNEKKTLDDSCFLESIE